MSLKRVLIALVLFGIAFGCVEAAVVVYLRTLGEPAREKALAGRVHDEVFPLLTLEEWDAVGTNFQRIAATEIVREFATIVMLAAIALAYAQNMRQWLAGFMIAFGVWDIFYYVFLKLFVDWPASVWTWDLLFLIPVPWSGPVITPVLVSLAMIGAGVAILAREFRGVPVHLAPSHWAAIVGGGLLVIVAFCWDFRGTARGDMPNPFNWPLFLAGLAVGVAGFAAALRRSDSCAAST